MAAQTTCERCGKSPVANYTFYYGRETGLPEYGSPVYRPGLGTTRDDVHHYQIGGSEEVPLCQSCVTRGRVIDVLKGIADLPILWLLLAAGALFAGAGVVQGNLLLSFGIIAAAVVGFGALFLISSAKRVGEETAIELRKKSVTEHGWTVFWTAGNYAKLHPETGRFGPLAR